jgi:hypothetical protein
MMCLMLIHQSASMFGFPALAAALGPLGSGYADTAAK